VRARRAGDARIAWLTTHGAFTPPAGAQVLTYAKGTTRTGAVHELVSANGEGVADRVDVGGVSRTSVALAPYDDRRWIRAGELEGTLGLDFFRPYTVVADWDAERF
jgi:hypothetical protein